jgi:hypothetical protein
MRHFYAAAVSLACFTLPLSAQGYIPNGKLDFTPAPNGVTIAGTTGHGARGTWCAAADYALNRLGASGAQNLYVSSPRTKGGGRNSVVSFTLDPTGLTPSNVFLVGGSLDRKGAELTINHALTFCADLRLPSR